MERTEVRTQGVRVPWSEVPAVVRRRVEGLLGAAVTSAETRHGGFSPAVAARLRLADGRTVFVKALSLDVNPDAPGLYRREARIAAALPASVPAARLLDWFEADGWLVLLFEDVPGEMPATPWRADELARVLDALTDLARTLTPSPIEAVTVAERYRGAFNGWRRLAESGADDLDPWAVRNLTRLVEIESGWEDAATGNTLIHCDLRADNVLLTPERVVFVDWPHACLAEPWFDLVAMLPSVAMSGGGDPDEILTRHPLADGVDAEAIDAVVAAIGGFFLAQSRLPDPPGLPTVRTFQRVQGEITLDWLRNRLERR